MPRPWRLGLRFGGHGGAVGVALDGPRELLQPQQLCGSTLQAVLPAASACCGAQAIEQCGAGQERGVQTAECELCRSQLIQVSARRCAPSQQSTGLLVSMVSQGQATTSAGTHLATLARDSPGSALLRQAPSCWPEPSSGTVGLCLLALHSVPAASCTCPPPHPHSSLPHGVQWQSSALQVLCSAEKQLQKPGHGSAASPAGTTTLLLPCLPQHLLCCRRILLQAAHPPGQSDKAINVLYWNKSSSKSIAAGCLFWQIRSTPEQSIAQKESSFPQPAPALSTGKMFCPLRALWVGAAQVWCSQCFLMPQSTAGSVPHL